MSGPFSDCTLTSDASAQALPEAVRASLAYQAGALGMTLPTASLSAKLILNAPGGAAACRIDGWPNAQAGDATELTAQAVCGLMSVHGRANRRALPLGVDYVSHLTAVLALQGMAATALAQRRGMALSSTTVSLGASALLAVGQYLAGATAPEGPERLLPGHAFETRPPFLSADGVIFEIEALDAPLWQRFWRAVGAADADIAAGWLPFMLRYAQAIAPVPAALGRALATLPFARIVAIGRETGMVVSAVRTLDERAADPDARELWTRGPWQFETLASSPAAWKSPDRPLPLAGLRVIESCRRIQGPLAGHLLAQLGAEVIRIEPPGGDPLRGMPPMAGEVSARFDALNRHKRTVEVDLKSATGHAEVLELVRDADVFLHNWAPGKAGEMRLDAGDLQRVRPGLVYAYAGGVPRGMDGSGLIGTDFLMQAHAGIARRIGDAADSAGGTLFTALDVMGGAVAAQGVTLALLRSHVQGRGIRVDTSLLGAATLLSADALAQRFDGAAATAGQGLAAVFDAQEGRIAIECADTPQIERLCAAVGLAPQPTAALSSALSLALARRPASAWQPVLREQGIPAAVVLDDLARLNEDPRLQPALVNDTYTQVDSPWSFQ